MTIDNCEHLKITRISNIAFYPAIIQGLFRAHLRTDNPVPFFKEPASGSRLLHVYLTTPFLFNREDVTRGRKTRDD